MLLLVNRDLGVYMVYRGVWDGAAIDLLQPFVSIVLFPELMILALERRRGFNPVDIVPTPTQKIWVFATALEQVRERAALGGIQVHHPPQGTPCFSWE